LDHPPEHQGHQRSHQSEGALRPDFDQFVCQRLLLLGNAGEVVIDI
jgi:hypothetical protein